jgi:hypothetical protein
MTVCGVHLKASREEDFEHLEKYQNRLFIMLLHTLQELSVKIFPVLAQETSLFEVLEIAHGQDLFWISNFLESSQVTAIFEVRLVQGRFLGLLLKPFEHENE